MLQAFANGYIWFFRGAPALIQLIFWFNLAIVVREVTLTLPYFGTIFSVRRNGNSGNAATVTFSAVGM